MKIAFYAPLKPPSHSVPSGDREMARALITAVEHAGHDVEVASDLRLFDGKGDPAVQADLAEHARKQSDVIIQRGPDWDIWLTYHNYYKAPDLIGPRVCAALGIPYIQIESTRAKKRLEDPWTQFAQAAEAATDAAHTVIYFTDRDAQALRRDAPPHQRLVHLPPFLQRLELPAASDLTGPLLTVAMMRSGDKTASYRTLSQALTRVDSNCDWQLDVAGDGENADEIRSLFASFGARVHLLGTLDKAALAHKYRHARALVWPGIGEAFGMVYLEAQAAGVPIIAQSHPGMREILTIPQPAPEEGAPALAARIETLWADRACARQEGAAGRRFIAENHLIASAAQTLGRVLEDAL